MYKSIMFKIMILSVCLCFAGCGKKDGIKTDAVEDNSYTTEDLFLLAENSEVYMELLQDHILYNTSGQSLVLSDQDGKNVVDLFQLESGNIIYAVGQTASQNILVLTKKEDKEDNQYECIEIDLTGQQKETQKMEEVSFSPKSIVKDNQGRLIVLSWEGDIFVYENSDKAGRKIEKTGFVESICLDGDGHVLFEENKEDVSHVVKLKEDLKNEEAEIVLNNDGMATEIFAGKDGKTYFWEEDYLYCFDLIQKRTRPVLRWIDEGIEPDSIRKVGVSKEGYICVAADDGGQCAIKKMMPVIKTNANKEELVLACVGLNSVIREQILKFNNESKNFKISIRDYGEEEDPYQALNMDIIAGEQFDIICMEGLNADNYIEKGLLADLSGYIDENDYVPGYMEAVKGDGGIYQISPYFTILTILGKASEVGEKSGWTSEEMITFFENNKDRRGLLYYDESDLLGVFIWSGLEGYLKEDEKGTHFQRESFQRTLKFIKTYQDYALKEENDSDIPSTDMVYCGDLLLLKAGICSGNDYRAYKTMFHSDIAAKGYPTGEEKGNYMSLGMPVAICSKSNQKEAAWEFISYLLEDQTQYNLKNYGFPVKQKVFEQLCDEWCGKEKSEEAELAITIEGREKKVPYLDEKEVNDLKKIIASSARLCVDSPELTEIVQEESQLYFQGRQDLENTCKYIENRIDTFLEERK